MRLTPIRAALIALVVASPFALNAFAQDDVPPADDPASATEDVAAGPHPRTAEEIYGDLEFFGEVLDRVRAGYVDAPDERELIRSAINGMLTSLDPHSAYLSPDQFVAVQEDTSGQFGGLGIEVTMDQGVIKVVTPIDDTPASRAGILANDYIVELNGRTVQGMVLDEAVEMMRGPIGSEVKITVIREGAMVPLYFTLARDVIATRVTRWSMEGDVLYLRLSRFSEQAYAGVQKSIKDAYAANKDVPPKGIVFDLRNNPGGLVDQAVLVSDAFLKQGAVVLTRGRVESESARYDAKPDDLDAKLADIPLIVLTNGGTASAAEIVAGALQDHKRATVLGTRSFGKGSVQSIINLGPDVGGIRLTTARYYTPNNRSIQAAGIQPDILVTQDVPLEFQGRDEVLGEAGLEGQIGGGTEEIATVGSSVFVPADKAADNQLQMAIKLIDGLETNAAFPPKADG